MQPSESNGRSRFKYFASSQRINIWYGFLLLVIAIFAARLFYLQVVRHDYYRQAALADQLKQYTIPAERGVIEAESGSGTVPLVLNQKLYTVYADPSFTSKNANSDASQIAKILGGKTGSYASLLAVQGSRYEVLAKKVNEDIAKRLLALKLPGVGAQAQDYRIYPQGNLAAQLLGFVDDQGNGQYGIEQYLNSELAGQAGTLKSITDASGVPLAASRDNIQVNPKPGQKVVLTVDLAMQKQLENILKKDVTYAEAPSGDALILDANTGAIKAMADYPSYDPSKFYNVRDPGVFQNAAVSAPLEVGSIMKTLTMATSLDLGLVTPKTTYYNPPSWTIDGHKITNVEPGGAAGQQSMASLLNLSLNTGATWLLMQMGGGQINQKARDTWHDYMVNHYQLGKPTGVEQAGESAGYIPDPDHGNALDLTYANTAFGQAMTATPLQMAAALAAIVNGGTYYQPHLVAETIDSSGKATLKQPVAVDKSVVSSKVSTDMMGLMEYVLKNHYPQPPFSGQYNVGGKTGTAQLASPSGGYYADRFNGTFMGFVGGDKPQYIIIARVDTPGIGGYAGTTAAMPIFVDLAHMLINNFNVLPKS